MNNESWSLKKEMTWLEKLDTSKKRLMGYSSTE